MKNLIAIATIILVTTFQASAFGPATSTTTLSVLTNEKAVVIRLAGTKSDVKLFTVKDEAGEIVFEEELDKYNDKVIYSLKKFPQGKYTIKVASEGHEEVLETVMTAKNLALENKSAHFKPVIEENEKGIILNGYFNDASNVQFKIFDADGELLYADNEKSVGNYTRIINLSKFENGIYTVVCNTDHFSVSREIKR